MVSPTIHPCARVSVGVDHSSNWVGLSIFATLYQPANCALFFGSSSTSAPTTSLFGSAVTTVIRSFVLDKVLRLALCRPREACSGFVSQGGAPGGLPPRMF